MKRLLAIFLTGCLILGPSIGVLAEGEESPQTPATVQEGVAATEGENATEPNGSQVSEDEKPTADAQTGERNAALAEADGSGDKTDDGQQAEDGEEAGDKDGTDEGKADFPGILT